MTSQVRAGVGVYAWMWVWVHAYAWVHIRVDIVHPRTYQAYAHISSHMQAYHHICERFGHNIPYYS